MENKSDLVKEPVAGTVEAGNTIYRICSRYTGNCW